MESAVVLKWLSRIKGPIFWVFRKIFAADFLVSVSLFSGLSLFSLVIILLHHVSRLDFYHMKQAWETTIYRGLAYFGLVAGTLGLFYALRLRKLGIMGADAEIEKGLDYKSAIKKVDKGFEFLGIGASKLTADSDAFEDAVARMSRKQLQIRMLLCDPRSSAIEGLESRAGVGVGRFRTNVNRSFTLLNELHRRFPHTLLIRLYDAKSDNDLPPFRLMFINQNECLVSQNILGADKEGKRLPQLLLHSDRLFDSEPTFYFSYKRLFEQLWDRSEAVEPGNLLKLFQKKAGLNRRTSADRRNNS